MKRTREQLEQRETALRPPVPPSCRASHAFVASGSYGGWSKGDQVTLHEPHWHAVELPHVAAFASGTLVNIAESRQVGFFARSTYSVGFDGRVVNGARLLYAINRGLRIRDIPRFMLITSKNGDGADMHMDNIGPSRDKASFTVNSEHKKRARRDIDLAPPPADAHHGASHQPVRPFTCCDAHGSRGTEPHWHHPVDDHLAVYTDGSVMNSETNRTLGFAVGAESTRMYVGVTSVGNIQRAVISFEASRGWKVPPGWVVDHSVERNKHDDRPDNLQALENATHCQKTGRSRSAKASQQARDAVSWVYHVHGAPRQGLESMARLVGVHSRTIRRWCDAAKAANESSFIIAPGHGEWSGKRVSFGPPSVEAIEGEEFRPAIRYVPDDERLHVRLLHVNGVEVSNMGRIRFTSDGRITLGTLHKEHGYQQICATVQERGKPQTILVHVLVASTFLPAPSDGRFVVDHLNSERTDNRASNLEWVTSAVNTQRAVGLKVAGVHSRTAEKREWPSISAAAQDLGMHSVTLGVALRTRATVEVDDWTLART